VNPALVDSNVLLDVITQDPKWLAWSAETLAALGNERVLVINPIIYTEVSIGFKRIEDLDDVLSIGLFRRDPLPFEAGFLAGKAFIRYRSIGGGKTAPLPDFYIGAHAAIRGFDLVTRDAARFRTYFPRVNLIAP
jgi:predicted nucleic acid-binding protein